MRAFLFPGQGSQAIGMGLSFFEAFPIAREAFEEVDDALKMRLSQMIFKGNPDELSLTENTQPALMAVSLAVVRTIVHQSGKEFEKLARYVAGHSLGEYSALCSAGSITLANTAQLLRERGCAMQDAVPVGQGGMAAILGPTLEEIEEIASEAAQDDVCVVANDNCPGQVVISGSAAAIERAGPIASGKGAKRYLPLSVSVPSHCPLMAPAAEKMRPLLRKTTVLPASIPVIANVTAMPVQDPSNIRNLLVDQLTQRVRWRETINNLVSLGVTEFVEVGAGKVLSGLVKRTCPDAKTYAINNPSDLEILFQNI